MDAFAKSLIGKHYNDWVILGDGGKGSGGRRLSWCRCICGTERICITDNLFNGRSSGCGCLSKKTAFSFLPRNASKCSCSTHVRHSWNMMLHRCFNKKYDAYSRYGGAGITVCEDWFYLKNFIRDMGDPPKGLTLDRISPFGNYEPGNCRWATRYEQNRNKKKHHTLCYKGERKLVIDWSRELNIEYATLMGRIIRGWGDEKVLTTPIDKSKRNMARRDVINRREMLNSAL